MRPRWQQEQMTQSKALVRQKMLGSNAVKIALNSYLQSLNLQKQLNNGTINEQQAMQLFYRAIQNFHQNLVNTVNQQFNPVNLPPDQTNLANPLNMQSALNNPNSFASQNFDDGVAACVAAAEDMMAQEQMMQNVMLQDDDGNQNQQGQQTQPGQNQNNNDEDSETKNSFESSAENIGKDALETTAAIDVVKSIDSGNTASLFEKMDQAYNKMTGMQGKFENLFKEAFGGAEESSTLTTAPVPRPPVKPPEDDKS